MTDVMDRQRSEILAGYSADGVAAFRSASEWMRNNGIDRYALEPGDRAPDFILPDGYGRLTSSRTLRRGGRSILAFVHGCWCPFCTAQLDAFVDALPEITSLGASLTIISPESGERLRALKTRKAFESLSILADLDFEVGLSFGVAFCMPGSVLDRLQDTLGSDLACRSPLPPTFCLPATFVVDHHGVVIDSGISADLTVWRDPLAIVDLLRFAP